jgi:hypothetical protein
MLVVPVNPLTQSTRRNRFPYLAATSFVHLVDLYSGNYEHSRSFLAFYGVNPISSLPAAANLPTFTSGSVFMRSFPVV